MKRISTVVAALVKGIEKLIRGWAMLFRFLFIAFIGLMGWNLIDPPGIGDIPFAQLTLNAIFKVIFATAVILACGVWFFCFPKRDENKPDADPYDYWANFSGLLVLVAFLIWAWRKGILH